MSEPTEPVVHVDRVVIEDKGKNRIFFDTGIQCVLYCREMRRYGIEEACDISSQQYQVLFSECLNKRARKRAMYLLERMDRTEQQLRDKLKENSYPQSCIDDAIEYVKRFRYLDDVRYARHFVEVSQHRLSRQQIRQKLIQKGIQREVAEQAVADVYENDEVQQIQTWIEKKRSVYNLSERKDMQKMYQFLLRRGFRGSDIQKALNCESCTIEHMFEAY